jgi:hypothetical protein
MENKIPVVNMRILVKVINSIGIKRGCTPFDTVYQIPLFNQDFGKVGTVMSGDAGDECCFLCHGNCFI